MLAGNLLEISRKISPNRPCEERSDEAIQEKSRCYQYLPGLLRYARKDDWGDASYIFQ